ncbi:hypothetical protein [Zavarzinia sp.]|uniref:hypothetical protein n=1 Tax=Zavarzinia sp. TaxID=2027920 RepID=UPI003561D0F2
MAEDQPEGKNVPPNISTVKSLTQEAISENRQAYDEVKQRWRDAAGSPDVRYRLKLDLAKLDRKLTGLQQQYVRELLNDPQAAAALQAVSIATADLKTAVARLKTAADTTAKVNEIVEIGAAILKVLVALA